MQLNKFPVKTSILVACAGLLVGFTQGISPDQTEPLVKFFSEAAQNQITQAGFFFTMAAWLHSGRVKKEIRENFMALTISIDKVADAFREDLKAQGNRVDNLASRVSDLEKITTGGHNVRR